MLWYMAKVEKRKNFELHMTGKKLVGKTERGIRH